MSAVVCNTLITWRTSVCRVLYVGRCGCVCALISSAAMWLTARCLHRLILGCGLDVKRFLCAVSARNLQKVLFRVVKGALLYGERWPFARLFAVFCNNGCQLSFCGCARVSVWGLSCEAQASSARLTVVMG